MGTWPGAASLVLVAQQLMSSSAHQPGEVARLVWGHQISSWFVCRPHVYKAVVFLSGNTQCWLHHDVRMKKSEMIACTEPTM